MKRVAIIGLGLMGGSLGLALKRLGLAHVSAYARRAETRKLALEMGATDAVHDTPQGALRGAELAVFCTPVCTMPKLAKDCMAAFEPGCVVTDVGSTKADLVRDMNSLFRDTTITFVGSHPMAGSERSGLDAARIDLYTGAVTAVTPGPGAPEAGIQSVVAFWGGVGARVVRLDPAEHDILVAKTSHLPHLISAVLVSTAGRTPQNMGLPLFCGPGFRDTTRIAGGSPAMWHDIVKSNRAAILEELRQYKNVLGELISLIESENYLGILDSLEKARFTRGQLLGTGVDKAERCGGDA
jgi:prephenate dehydrogenase